MPRNITADDQYRIRQPSSCVISPDGKSIAVVITHSERESLKQKSHIWLVPTSGEEPRQYTRGTGSDRNPRFSPDGGLLAFISSRSGKSEIWTMPTDGGEARQLTELAGTISEIAFSPDGRKLAAIFTPQDEEAKEREQKKKQGKPGHESPKVRVLDRIQYKFDGSGFLPKGRPHLWIVDVKSGRARQLTTDERYEEFSPVFSPDGKSIYFNSNRTKDPDLDLMRVDIWRIPVRGGEIERIRTFDGPATNFSISPDGRWVTFLGTEDPDAGWGLKHTKAWLAPANGGRPTELTSRLDRSCWNLTISDTFGIAPTDAPVWSPDSQWVYFVVSTEGFDGNLLEYFGFTVKITVLSC